MAGVEKKRHFVDQDKQKTVAFLRAHAEPLCTISWLLCVSLGALAGWDREFDEQLRQHPKSDERGKASKVSIEVVRLVVETAQGILDRGERLNLERFTRFLQAKKGLDLSRKTVQEILIANGLWQTRTRKKRPKFFKNLCQRIPNGLFSCDGGEFEVVLGDQTLKYNVELGVDVGSFCHTSHAITPTETSDAVLKVLKDHCQEWGTPLGVLFDHGSANLSEKVGQYLQKQGIEVVPAGPGNPKGNGSLESAIGQMREAIGPIKIDMSSATAMGQSILDMVISLYRKMRNKLPLRNPRPTPFEQMTAPTSEHERQLERNRLAAHKQSKDKTDADIEKVEKIHWLVKFHELMPEPAALKRAEQSIRRHDMEAIIKSEEAFLKAVNRDPSRRNLSYFFGILRNIQQDMDDQRYEQYCRKKYSHSFFLEREREKQAMENAPTIAGIISIAKSVLALTAQNIKKIATRTCRMRLAQLLSTKKYLGPIRKQIQEAIGTQKDLALEQKEELANFIDELINQTAEA